MHFVRRRLAVATLGAIALAAPLPALAEPPAPKPAAQKLAAAKPGVTLEAKADLGSQRLTVIENGRVVGVWPISSGVEDHATPRGVFQPQWTSRIWYSHTYDNAPMPHAVFFNGGIATHATNATGALGRPASHGCVRLSPGNAERFYNLVKVHGLTHTRITVQGTPHYEHQSVAGRRMETRTRLASASGQRPLPYRHAPQEDNGIFASGHGFLPLSLSNIRFN